MKLNNRKGFTLIELLVVIIIVALVIGFSTYGIIKILNNSKEQSITLTEENILETARIYSSEASSDSWKGTNNDYDVFCVTIGELMNKGLLEKNSTIENKNINKNTYVAVKRNKVTLAVEKEEFALSAINEENICTGEYISNNVDITKPKVGTSISYTDKIQITFENGSISSNGTTSPVTYKCLYGTNSSNVNKEGIISENNCILNNLKSNSDYYVLIYMNSNNGVSVVAEGNNNFKTTDFVVPTINQDKNNVTINYTDIDNNGNPINNPSHYFKSSINAASSIQIEKCTIKNEILSCSDKTNNIEANVWYKVSASNVIVTYPEANNTVVINARIYDGSNNYGESTNNYKINKYTVKFHKGNAISIDGNTSNYIEKYCISGGNDSCEITSPIITPPTGYSTVGWNTDGSATTSSWNQNTKKNINNDYNYYPILKINYVYINYNTNGGTVTPNTTNESGVVNTWTINDDNVYKNGNVYTTKIKYDETTLDEGLANYNNSKNLYIAKTGYIALSGEEWKCLSGCITDNKVYDQAKIYNASDFCDASSSDCTVTVKVNWIPKTYAVVLDNQGATNAGTTSIYGRYNTGIYLDSNYVNKMSTNANKITIPTKTGYTFGGYYTSTGGSGTQLISSTGYITNSFTNTKYSSAATLYAKWTPKTYTITLDNQNATSAGTTALYGKYATGIYLDNNYSTQITGSTNKITLPTKTGYTFGGYYTSIGGSGTQLLNSSGYLRSGFTNTLYSSNVTLYAKWTNKIFEIILDKRGGTGGTDGPIYLEYGTGWYSDSTADTIITEIDIPSKSGYNFTGYYYTNSLGNEITIVNSSGTIKLSSTGFTTSHTIYAKWTVKSSGSTEDVGRGAGCYVGATAQGEGNPTWWDVDPDLNSDQQTHKKVDNSECEGSGTTNPPSGSNSDNTETSGATKCSSLCSAMGMTSKYSANSCWCCVSGTTSCTLQGAM